MYRISALFGYMLVCLFFLGFQDPALAEEAYFCLQNTKDDRFHTCCKDFSGEFAAVRRALCLDPDTGEEDTDTVAITKDWQEIGIGASKRCGPCDRPRPSPRRGVWRGNEDQIKARPNTAPLPAAVSAEPAAK